MTPIERCLRVGLEEVVSDMKFLHARLYETGNDLADFVRDSHDVAHSYLITAQIHEANMNEEKKHEAARKAVAALHALVADGAVRLPAPEAGPVSEDDPAAEQAGVR